MALIVGQIQVKHFDPPPDAADDFVVELMEIASWSNYMAGEGRVWGHFTRSQLRKVADKVVAEKGLTNIERAEIDSWVDSLPWDADFGTERYIDLYFED